jgi:hypothetical protein
LVLAGLPATAGAAVLLTGPGFAALPRAAARMLAVSLTTGPAAFSGAAFAAVVAALAGGLAATAAVGFGAAGAAALGADFSPRAAASISATLKPLAGFAGKEPADGAGGAEAGSAVDRGAVCAGSGEVSAAFGGVGAGFAPLFSARAAASISSTESLRLSAISRLVPIGVRS